MGCPVADQRWSLTAGCVAASYSPCEVGPRVGRSVSMRSGGALPMPVLCPSRGAKATETTPLNNNNSVPNLTNYTG